MSTKWNNLNINHIRIFFFLYHYIGYMEFKARKETDVCFTEEDGPSKNINKEYGKWFFPSYSHRKLTAFIEFHLHSSQMPSIITWLIHPFLTKDQHEFSLLSPDCGFYSLLHFKRLGFGAQMFFSFCYCLGESTWKVVSFSSLLGHYEFCETIYLPSFLSLTRVIFTIISHPPPMLHPWASVAWEAVPFYLIPVSESFGICF